jgi:hypothetical protein
VEHVDPVTHASGGARAWCMDEEEITKNADMEEDKMGK